MDNVLRPCTPKESLRQSLNEMQLIRKGKAPRRDVEEFLDELKQELKNDEI